MYLFLRLESIGCILIFLSLLIYSAIQGIIFLDSILKLIFDLLTYSFNFLSFFYFVSFFLVIFFLFLFFFQVFLVLLVLLVFSGFSSFSINILSSFCSFCLFFFKLFSSPITIFLFFLLLVFIVLLGLRNLYIVRNFLMKKMIHISARLVHYTVLCTTYIFCGIYLPNITTE